VTVAGAEEATTGTSTKRRSRARWIAGFVLVAVAALVVVLAMRPAADSETPASPLVGRPAPEVRGTALDGRSVDLAAMRGRWVVVNFFATWGVPCRQEHPELKAYTEAHTGPQSPAVIAIAYDENDIASARSFFAQNGGSWPVVPDAGGHAAVDYGVRGLPESYVVDPAGNIAAHVTGKVTAAAIEAITGNAP